MSNWCYFDLQRIVSKAIRYEHNYYCQIHDMPTAFMSLKELKKVMPIILKEDFRKNVNEKDKNEYLSKVKTGIESTHASCCLNGMNKSHMYPEEIMSHIINLLRMKPDDAWDNIEKSIQRLFALKLDKELPRNDGVQDKRIKI